MDEQLERLVHLQRIDARIFATKRIIAGFPKKISEAEAPFKELQKSLNEATQRLDSIEKRKREKERATDDLEEKIRKLKARTSEIKTNKEYQALLNEIQAVENERSLLEDEILMIMEETETASKKIRAEEDTFALEKEKIEVLKQKIADEKSEFERTLESMQKERAGVAEAISRENYKEYMELLKTAGGMAVAEARDEICQGCNMNIPPQLFVELKKNEGIVHCPQCRRILFYGNSS